MKAFGLTVIVLGILACCFAGFVGVDSTRGDNEGLGAIAVSICGGRDCGSSGHHPPKFKLIHYPRMGSGRF